MQLLGLGWLHVNGETVTKITRKGIKLGNQFIKLKAATKMALAGEFSAPAE